MWWHWGGVVEEEDKNLNGILMFIKIVFKKVFRGDLIKLFSPLHRFLVLQIFIRTVVPVFNFFDMVTKFHIIKSGRDSDP
jgi:hypothetical protein